MRYLPAHRRRPRGDARPDRRTLDRRSLRRRARATGGSTVCSTCRRRKSEIEVERILGHMAARNVAAGSVPFFVGAGAYRHHVPASVDHLIQRSEFLTSYTPYQPEIAQGTLQYLFEFQTQVANLTAMEVANASMYDGSTATAEAVLMAHRAHQAAEGGAVRRAPSAISRASSRRSRAWPATTLDAMPPDPGRHRGYPCGNRRRDRPAWSSSRRLSTATSSI